MESREAGVTIAALRQMKRDGRKIVGVVAWDYQIAQIVDRAGVEIVSVGDSVGVNLWGRADPLQVTMDEMVLVCNAVRRGVKRALVSCDFPFGPLQQGTASALEAALRLKEAGADMVKLDGAADFPDAVRAVARAGIPVFAQFGITPQTATQHGAAPASAAEMTARRVEEAKRLEDAGASLLDFTHSGPIAGAAVVRAVRIPVIGGLGGGPWLDGRMRMAHAAIGYAASALDSNTENYANVARITLEAITAYAEDVRAARQIKGAVPRETLTMPFAVIDGIATRYEVIGAGPPLLMYAPAGFNATLEKWTTQGVYARIRLLDHLPQKYTCIVFDRRECGQSGGRVERLTWAHYAAQGKGLLEHLGIERAHLMGGCMGCCAVVAFGVAYPEATLSMVLWWPVGGAKYRINTRARFAEHLKYVEEHGLAQVVSLVTRDGKPFGADARGGPWASVIRHDRAFAESYAKLNVDEYKLTVDGMARGLFDRDTSPGAEPEELLALDVPALIVPGRDATHATSAARYLEECLPRAEYWNVLPEEQTEQTAPARMLAFLDKAAD